jgi:hypothetical protein
MPGNQQSEEGQMKNDKQEQETQKSILVMAELEQVTGGCAQCGPGGCGGAGNRLLARRPGFGPGLALARGYGWGW